MKISLAKIAEKVGGEVKGDCDKTICGAAPFEKATSDDITYAGGAKFLKRVCETGAGAVIVPLNWPAVSDDPLSVGTDAGQRTMNYLLVENPQVAFVKVLEFFCPSSTPKQGISPNACIGKGFGSGEDISVGHFVAIGNDVNIGDRVTLCPNSVIGDNVVIGSDVRIYPNVTILDRCRIGSRVTIHSGTVIGSDGFGFAPDGKKYRKIPHTGIVQIDDDVEIGAGNTIDRATFGKTWIKSGVKTDNLVHIAHNVTVGENTVLVAQVGIAGSVTIGRNATFAGQVGVAGHLTIGNDVTVGPQAGVAKSVPDGEVVSGTPEMPHQLWLRVQRIIPRLPEIKKKLAELERKLDTLS